MTEKFGTHLGKADWIWDDELGVHLPCCVQIREKGTGYKCGNGPLEGDQILTGDCGDDHQWSRQFSKGMTPSTRAALYQMMTNRNDHPWYSPLKIRSVRHGCAIVLDKELIYTRILRVRFTENPLKRSSARIWLGHLEIVLDPIRKSSWIKRKRMKP